MAKPLRIVNLEQGFPTREEAITRLDQALQQARKSGAPAVKIIHGWGSSGAGGVLRFAIRSYLRQRKEAGEIRVFVAGESWSKFDEHSKELLKHVSQALLDSDLGRANKGITLVLL